MAAPVDSSAGRVRRKMAVGEGRSLQHWLRRPRDVQQRRSVTMAEVEQHNKQDDCWTVFRGKVYDTTAFFEYHPGGAQYMMMAAGRDGTKLFDQYHKWVNIDFIMDKSFIGNLADEAGKAPATLEEDEEFDEEAEEEAEAEEQPGAASSSTNPTGPSSAQLTGIRQLSSEVRVFTFQLDQPLSAYKPGMYMIFDLSSAFAAPNVLRSWTISSAADDLRSVSVTVKKVPGGRGSSLLHAIDPSTKEPLTLKVAGPAGYFSCFAPDTDAHLRAVPPKMVWIAGGIGITPLLAMLEGLQRLAARMHSGSGSRAPLLTDIVFLFACRGDGLPLLQELPKLPPAVRVRGQVFFSDAGGADRDVSGVAGEWAVHGRRVNEGDVKGIEDLSEREAFICGPAALEGAATRWLGAGGVRPREIHTESFA